jgi:hypothetical protein
MVTISFYSYKGGVGRSLTLANLGVYLAQFGATVVMVDFDLEAPGLHYKLSPEGPIDIASRGLAGLLADASREKPISEIDWNLEMDVSEHAQTPLSGNSEEETSDGRLHLVPAGNPLRPDYWNDLAAIDWDRLFVAGERPGVFALRKLKNEIEARIDPDVLLVDSRTGITPGGGVSTTLLPDVVVTMMLNTAEHLDGSRLVLSAVSSAQRGDSPGPVVVPVLSRYTSPRLAERDRLERSGATRVRPRSEQLQMLEAIPESLEDVPLSSLGDKLLEGLSKDAASRIKAPLVLHADPILQQREYLTFGRYAQSELGASGQTLLEDYLRLFAELVPEETFFKYLNGVRERARSILLDNPDDAVQSLESLVTLTGDEGSFADLVKVYLLRRETRKLVSAAEGLYRVHGRVVPDPALTRELRSLITARVRVQQRLGTDAPGVSASFAEAYWSSVAITDAEWGAWVARIYAERGEPDRARVVADTVLREAIDTQGLADLVRVLALGTSSASEELSVEIATENFEAGKESIVFLRAAALAAGYQRERELAARITVTPGSEDLPPETRVRLLLLAGEVREAAALFIDGFGDSDPDDVDIEGLHELWVPLGKRVAQLRQEFHERNPYLADRLDRYDEDDPF